MPFIKLAAQGLKGFIEVRFEMLDVRLEIWDVRSENLVVGF
jgi:hypothetical protein